jgi:glycosyltransferase involved in cell wall biosynthesis
LKGGEPGYVPAYKAATARMTDALVERLQEAWERRSEYEALSAGALEAANTRFNPETAKARLEKIYERFR